jgi:AAA domain
MVDDLDSLEAILARPEVRARREEIARQHSAGWHPDVGRGAHLRNGHGKRMPMAPVPESEDPAAGMPPIGGGAPGETAGTGQRGPDGSRGTPPTPVASAKEGRKAPSWRDDIVKARDLCKKRFADLKYCIPGLIPEGVTLLVSRPKLGKSWLLIQIAAQRALGRIMIPGTHEITPAGDVLMLCLEDGERRLQRRLKKYFGSSEETWPERIATVYKWKKLDQGGIDNLREWCKSVPTPVLITIDTLKKVRPKAKALEGGYDSDYQACEQLIQLCHEFPGLAIIIAHHDRKADAEDVFDTISGTLGLSGGVDAMILLKRSANKATMHIQGRDLEDILEKAINFDRDTARWMVLGEATEVHRSKDEKAVLAALADAGDLGMKVADILARIGLKQGGRNKLDLLLGRMLAAGLIERSGRGVYRIPAERA